MNEETISDADPNAAGTYRGAELQSLGQISLFSIQKYMLAILRQDIYVLYFNTPCTLVNV
jgi:hypothetical protein